MEKIYSASLKPNIISFNNLLGACAVVGSLSEARKVFEKMRQAAVAPDGFSYLWMIKAAGRQGLGPRLFFDRASKPNTAA